MDSRVISKGEQHISQQPQRSKREDDEEDDDNNYNNERNFDPSQTHGQFSSELAERRLPQGTMEYVDTYIDSRGEYTYVYHDQHPSSPREYALINLADDQNHRVFEDRATAVTYVEYENEVWREHATQRINPARGSTVTRRNDTRQPEGRGDPRNQTSGNKSNPSSPFGTINGRKRK